MKQLTMGIAVFVSICAGGSPAEAQEVASTFEQLAVLVKPGDTIRVTDVTGRETRGRIGTLSGDELILNTSAGPRKLGEADLATISQRRGDSLKNGAIIGAVAGAAYFGTMMAIFSQYNDGGDVIVAGAVTGGVLVVGLGAAAGAGIDALIARHQVIYQKGATGRRSIGVSPLFGHGRRGAVVTITF